MHVRIMKFVPNQKTDLGVAGMAAWECPPQFETLIECMKLDDLPISIGRQEMTFEGFDEINPETVYFVEGVRRHIKKPDPSEGQVTMRHAVYRPLPPPHIDATIYVRA